MAQREHSALELRRKLERKGYIDVEIIPLLDKLKAQGWQDDLRFALAYTHSRQARGYGPLRVEQELNARGVAETIVDEVINEQAHEWAETLTMLISKKFAGALVPDFVARAKQFRFLQYRGFSTWHIKQYLKEFDL